MKAAPDVMIILCRNGSNDVKILVVNVPALYSGGYGNVSGNKPYVRGVCCSARMQDRSYVPLSIQWMVIWHRVGIAWLERTRLKIVNVLKVLYCDCFTVVQLGTPTVTWFQQDHLMNVWSEVTLVEHYNSHL